MPVAGPAWAWSSAMSPRSRSGTAPSPGTRADLICHSAALCLARCDRPALLSDYSHRRSSRTPATGRAGSASGLRNSGSTAPGRIRTRRTSADLASSSCSDRSFPVGTTTPSTTTLRVARRGPASLRPFIAVWSILGGALPEENPVITAPLRHMSLAWRLLADIAANAIYGCGSRHYRSVYAVSEHHRPDRIDRRLPPHPAMPTDPFPVLLPFTDAAPPSSRSTRCDSPTNPTPSTGAVQWGHRVQASGIEIDETRYYSNDHPPLHRRRT